MPSVSHNDEGSNESERVLNWYSVVKLSMPIDDSRLNQLHYFDIGHPDSSDTDSYSNSNIHRVDLWFISKNYKFYSKEIDPSVRYTHKDMLQDLGFEDEDIIAKGRYEESDFYPQGLCSFTFWVFGIGDNKKKYIKKRVEKILDYQYSNPIIKLV